MSQLCISVIYTSCILGDRLPNFIFFLADDLGFNDVGWRLSTNTYTPDLNELKQESIELTRFYVYAKCSPSRTSFFTGRYNHNIGMQHDVGILEWFSCGLEPNSNTTYFTSKLKDCAGYDNYYIGKWHQVQNLYIQSIIVCIQYIIYIDRQHI